MAGTIKANAVQLGDSATAANNFVLQTNTDGTAKLSRGNLGATTQDILTVDATGLVSFAGFLTGNAATATQLSTATGSAPSYSCRAWVNFNGTGVVAIRASGNVSSITDNGVGDYTVNFTTALSDTNYAFSGSGGSSGDANNYNARSITPKTYSTGSLRVFCLQNAALDQEFINVAIFR